MDLNVLYGQCPDTQILHPRNVPWISDFFIFHFKSTFPTENCTPCPRNPIVADALIQFQDMYYFLYKECIHKDL